MTNVEFRICFFCRSVVNGFQSTRHLRSAMWNSLPGLRLSAWCWTIFLAVMLMSCCIAQFPYHLRCSRHAATDSWVRSFEMEIGPSLYWKTMKNLDTGVSTNGGTPKSFIFMGFSPWNLPFRATPMAMETPFLGPQRWIPILIFDLVAFTVQGLRPRARIWSGQDGSKFHGLGNTCGRQTGVFAKSFSGPVGTRRIHLAYTTYPYHRPNIKKNPTKQIPTEIQRALIKYTKYNFESILILNSYFPNCDISEFL